MTLAEIVFAAIKQYIHDELAFKAILVAGKSLPFEVARPGMQDATYAT